MRTPTHPGAILDAEFIRPLGLTVEALARDLGMDTADLRAVVEQRAAVTPQIAHDLAGRLGTSRAFWTRLQAAHDGVDNTTSGA